MESILRELYHGNIRPDCRVYAKDSPFVKAARVKHDSLEKLEATLDDSEKDAFDKFCEAQSEIEDITKFDTFTDALKFGMLLMIEIFSDGNETGSKGGAGGK